MLSQVKLLDEMDESMWQLLRKNLTGITEQEADWRPHPAANPVRWMLGHLTWFEEWACAALDRSGRYLTDNDPTAYLDGTVEELLVRFEAARERYRKRLSALTEADLSQQLSYFGRYEVSDRVAEDTRASPGRPPLSDPLRSRHVQPRAWYQQIRFRSLVA
jgi:hypothetical protein